MSLHLQMDDIGDAPGSAEDCEILRVQSGDSAAFAPLMRRHYATVLASARRHAPEAHLAEDIAIETFTFAWRNIVRFHAGTNFGAWLRSIAWQISRACRQRENSRGRLLENYTEHCRSQEPAPSTWALADRVAQVFALIESLPRERRQLVMLCDYEGRSRAEAAGRLHRTPGWVRTMLHRTRRELRAALVRSDAQGESPVQAPNPEPANQRKPTPTTP